jgi:N-acetylglutamate synthase-like GNAT family acetyltransferase|tara:strand:- start:286 stop:747 length:462 start_codon:yes stop_codon:yes gene_type:complete
MNIRKAKLKDAGKISNLIKQTLEKVNSKDYSKKQTKILKDGNSVKEIQRKIKEREVFCIFENESLVGTASFYGKNTIGGFFVKHTQIGKGVGKKLLKFIENYAKKRSVKKIKLYSTKYALKFYKNNGYKVRKRYSDKIKRISFPVILMEKRLK